MRKRSTVYFRLPLPLCRLLFFFSVLSQLSAAVRTVVDKENLLLGESTSLRIIVENARPENIEPFPQLPGLNIRYAGPTQGLTVVNGQSTSSVTFNYTVTAQREGVYTLPSIKVSAGGQRYDSQPVKLTVTRTPPQAGTREAFAKLLVPTTNLYVGEVIPIEIQLFVTQADQLQLPTLASDGFIIQKQAPYTKSQSQIGNLLYNVLSFKSAISAAKAGELVLGPAELSFNLLIRQRNNDPFADFFGRNYSRSPTTVKTEQYTMHVSPLPATNVPPGFSGAIGTFAMNVDASPLTLTAGDPVTLRMTISGRGNLEAIQMPKFNWPGFKFYEPQSSVNTTDPLGMQGSKNFEQVIIPENPALKELPEIKFSFFDPTAREYRTLSRSAMPLQVKPSPGAAPAVVGEAAKSSAEPPPAPRDIVHIKTGPGALVALAPPLITQPWFLAGQSLPLLALLAAYIYRKRADKLANNPRLRQKLRTRTVVQEGLVQLEKLASSQQTDQFYALVFRLLQEQLGERLNSPASAITEAVLDQELPRRGAPADLVAGLHHLFQECNQARYAPGGPGGHLQALLPKVRSSLTALQSLPD